MKNSGLSEEEVAERILLHGYNELPANQPKTILSFLFDILREPMLLLLLAACSIYLILGDLNEALILFFSVFVIIGITFYQEHRTERTLEALRDLSSPRALVVREGIEKYIKSRDLVPDDILIIKEGDHVPADCTLLYCNNVYADESLLTGESVPISKRIANAGESLRPPGGDNLPFLYSGSLITQGQGIAQVHATGLNSEIGKIGKALNTLSTEPTSIQTETRRAVLIFAGLGSFLCLAVVMLYGLTRHDWLNAVLSGVTVAMANIPEEFPVVITIFLALGAWRISKKGVLARQPSAIEMLGATTVLCVDKTGTLTQNRMSIHSLWRDGNYLQLNQQHGSSLQAPLKEIIEYGVLASEIDPFDPMEKAFHAASHTYLGQPEYDHSSWKIIHEYPFSPELPAHAHIWNTTTTYVVAVKGAPEAVLELCNLTTAQKEVILKQVADMAKYGLRVLAVGKSTLTPSLNEDRSWPSSMKGIPFIFIGLVGLEDPVRPSVPSAIKECYNAGVRVVMITGDYPGTAKAIAEQIGLRSLDNTITGAEINQLSDKRLGSEITKANIFARVVPEQKLRIVQQLKVAGEVVAMTGDGVNDAPALKAAHIGVAMGKRGTDIAREASSLILLEDDFASMVHAIRLGRRIFDNIQKATRYIISVHVPTAGLAILPFFFGWPLVLYPVHVVFLELIIDPACSLVFEAEPAERNIMHRPPRRKNLRLFDTSLITVSLLQGICILTILTILYGYTLSIGYSENLARNITFTSMVLCNLGLIFINRSSRLTLINIISSSNPIAWWIFSIGALATVMVNIFPAMRSIFRLDSLNSSGFILCFVGTVIAIALCEIIKLLFNKK